VSHPGEAEEMKKLGLTVDHYLTGKPPKGLFGDDGKDALPSPQL
jgi:hypothetical protein